MAWYEYNGDMTTERGKVETVTMTRDYEAEFRAWQSRRSAVMDAMYEYSESVNEWDVTHEDYSEFIARRNLARYEFLRAFTVTLMDYVTDDAVERGLCDVSTYLPDAV